jgi:hypothetical protein
MTEPTQYFRTGAGAVIANAAGFVLAFERADIPGAWQLPQGGLEAGEEPLQAILEGDHRGDSDFTERLGTSRLLPGTARL